MTAVTCNEDLPSDVQGTAARDEFPQVGANPAARQMQQPGVQGWFTDSTSDTRVKGKYKSTLLGSAAYISHVRSVNYVLTSMFATDFHDDILDLH